MRLVLAFIQFWFDFIVGDAWEVAVGVGVSLILIGVAVDRYGGATWLSFVLFAAVLAFNALAILRATAGKRT
jgi:hypothetical protein